MPEHSTAIIRAAWIGGILAIIAAIIAGVIGWGVPFVEKLAKQIEPTPYPTYTPYPTFTPFPIVGTGQGQATTSPSTSVLPTVPQPTSQSSTVAPSPRPTLKPTDIPTAAPVRPSPTTCFPQTGWTPPKSMPNGEWIYDCLSSGAGNWVGQDENWKMANWKRGTGQSEIVNIVVPAGATKMGLGCDPCTVLMPDGSTISSPHGDIGPFKPNININVVSGQTYKVRIFGGDKCPTRPSPCAPEIYIWFNLP